jgi:hypothetical protein
MNGSSRSKDSKSLLLSLATRVMQDWFITMRNSMQPIDNVNVRPAFNSIQGWREAFVKHNLCDKASVSFVFIRCFSANKSNGSIINYLKIVIFHSFHSTFPPSDTASPHALAARIVGRVLAAGTLHGDVIGCQARRTINITDKTDIVY